MTQQRTFNAKGQIGAMKAKWSAHRAAGERLNASHFRATIEGYDHLDLLFSSFQWPEMTRQEIESFGPMGTESNFQGNFKNSGQVTTSIEELISGTTLATIRDIILQKKYVDITFYITPEEKQGSPVLERRLLECSLSTDAIDFANESVTELVKVPLTIKYNWAE